MPVKHNLIYLICMLKQDKIDNLLLRPYDMHTLPFRNLKKLIFFFHDKNKFSLKELKSLADIWKTLWTLCGTSYW